MVDTCPQLRINVLKDTTIAFTIGCKMLPNNKY